jgi:hypothetical protein
MGIDSDKAVRYHSDRRGTAVNFEALGKAVRKVRACEEPMLCEAALAGWKSEIEEDYEARK